MCGIAGALSLSPDRRPDPQRVAAMSCLIAHRGPDGEGLWTSPSGRACFAHRRLSVIDIATGQQPMVDPSGTLGLVFNGEIYNYLDLRRTVEQRGVALRTTSDTEAVLYQFRDLGTQAVESFRGMFAFAAWDDRTGAFLIARDRIGKKPLFYLVEDGILYFASALAALRAGASKPWTIDLGAIDDFLALSYIPAPTTIYREVRKLEAGTLLTSESADLTPRRYWNLAEPLPAFEGSYDDAVQRLDDLLGTAVRLRLQSEVPLGVFLSGGIDSSLVAAVAARESPSRIHTFSISFGDAGFDESPFAAAVAQRLGTEHHVFHATPNLLDALPDMVRHFGEPFGDSSALNVWLLARETRQYVTVAVGGDGGDEVFAGYDWYRTGTRLEGLSRRLPPVLARGGRSLVGLAGRSGLGIRQIGQARRALGVLGEASPAERFAALRTFVAPDELNGWYGPQLRQARAGHRSANDLLASLYNESPGSPLRKMRYVDFLTYLADCLMPKVDVATMAFGLEARAPLLDQEIVRFGLSLPDALLMSPAGGKRILRTLLERFLPSSLFDRPKQGFSVPLPAWFAGSLRRVVDRLATSKRLTESGLLSAAGIEFMVREHASGHRDHSQRLFNLLVLDEWLRAHGGTP